MSFLIAASINFLLSIYPLYPVSVWTYAYDDQDGNPKFAIELYPLAVRFHLGKCAKQVRMWRHEEMGSVKQQAMRLFGKEFPETSIGFDEQLSLFVLSTAQSGNEQHELCDIFISQDKDEPRFHHKGKELTMYTIYTNSTNDTTAMVKIPRHWFDCWKKFVETDEAVALPGPVDTRSLEGMNPADDVEVPENFFLLLQKWYGIDGETIYVKV